MPFLGAGANLCDRPASGLGARVATCRAAGSWPTTWPRVRTTRPRICATSLRVSQYVAGQARRRLAVRAPARHFAFDYDRPLSPLPRRACPPSSRRRARGAYQLILTTNYDDALERAFAEPASRTTSSYYVAEGSDARAASCTSPPDGTPRVIDRPNEYRELSPEDRTVILKLHGAVDRRTTGGDSYVITEDHYIEFLTHASSADLLPATLLAKLLHEPLPVPGLRPARLEPARDPAPDLGAAGARRSLLGGPGPHRRRSIGSAWQRSRRVEIFERAAGRVRAGLEAVLAAVVPSAAQ